MIIITYSGNVPGINDEPSVRLLLSAYPQAYVKITPLGQPYVLTGQEELVICVGGEEVNGTTADLGYITPQNLGGEKQGRVDLFYSKGKKFLVLTGVTTGDLQKDAEGTIIACYDIYDNGVPDFAGGYTISGETNDLHLLKFKLDANLKSVCLDHELALKNYITTETKKLGEKYEIIDFYVDGDYAICIGRVYGTDPFTITVVAIIVIAAVVGIYGVGRIVKQWKAPEVEQYKASQEIAIAMQKKATADTTFYNNLQADYLNLPPEQQNAAFMAMIKSKDLSEATSKSMVDTMKAYEEKPWSEQLKDVLKYTLGAVVVAGGIYFIFKSGLFARGAEEVKKRVSKKEE